MDGITENEQEAESELSYGSFSKQRPWIVSPAQMEWLPQTTLLREMAARSVPQLIKRTRIPPGRRVLGTGYRLGKALLLWRVFERNHEGVNSRAALSKRLRDAFEALGPTYIKLGQIISAGEGLFPDELVTQFKELRDQVRAEPFDIVRSTVESELHCPLEEVFSSFDREALAAASIAQVHRATLRSGEEVVVKVQRSNVSERVMLDIAAMNWISPYLVGRIPVAALANPPAFVELFTNTIVEELDFRLEAANMLDIAKILAETGQRSLIVPRPHPRWVTRKVLVMERLEGFGWEDVEGMRAAGIDTTKVLRAGLVSFLEGAILFGVFHGDLHGGNLLVQSDGTVALLDFGMTGRLNEKQRLAFMRLLFGGTINDVKLQVEALRDLGALPKDTDIPRIISDLGLDRPAKDPTKMSPDELMSEIRNLTKALLGYGAKLPKELMLFVKNMLFLNASITFLAPEVDIFAEISYVVTYFTTRHGSKLSHELGVDVSKTEVDISGVRNSLGLDESVDEITYAELLERREIIRRRMTEHVATSKQRRGLSLRRLGGPSRR